MKFDNVVSTVSEARWHLLPAGRFLCVHLDGMSPQYLKVKNKYLKPYRKLVEHNALDPVIDRECVVKAFVEYCVRGWDKVTSDGEPVPFTFDNAVDLLTASPQTFYDLLQMCGDIENYKPSDEQLGNSATVSNTN